MNQAMRWKRFIEWWSMQPISYLSKMTGEGVAALVQEKIDDLRSDIDD